MIAVISNNANSTIQHNGSIFLNGSVSFVMSAGDTLYLRRIGGNWKEAGRFKG